MSTSDQMKTQSDDKEDDSDLRARLIALEILVSVLDRKTPLDQVLDMSANFNALAARDRGFCRMLATTVIRRLGQLDDVIAAMQDKPDGVKMPKVMHILRLGAAQIFFMDGVPDHAAVDTSVRLCEAVGAARQKGFVNAVLRELTRRGAARIERQDAGRINTPEWLLKYWIEDYGLSVAGHIANANLAEAPLDITIKASENPSYWAGALNAEILPTGTLRRPAGGNIRDLEGFDTGHWWIQDAAAALPAQLFGSVRGREVFDLCAAPGGKTLQLAALGAHVTAIDRSAQRLKRLEENVARMELQDRVTVIAADATQWNPPHAPELILLDAPCSATGTLRRNPDTSWLKSPQDIDRLCIIQEKLLAHTAQILAVGGTVIYCTCSLQKVEGEVQIEKLLQQRGDMRRVPVHADEIGGLEEIITPQGDVRILPHYLEQFGGIDGFFIARLTKCNP